MLSTRVARIWACMPMGGDVCVARTHYVDERGRRCFLSGVWSVDDMGLSLPIGKSSEEGLTSALDALMHSSQSHDKNAHIWKPKPALSDIAHFRPRGKVQYRLAW